MKSIHSKQEYIKLLQIFYTYFGALEEKINRFISPDLLADYDERRKAQSLRADITALDGPVPQLAPENDTPAITDSLQAFGALYVIEGSTLGGQIISKMMARQLNINDSKGLSFFNSYGDQTETKWAAFKDVLNHQAKTDDDAERVIEAADATFLKFNSWFEKHGREKEFRL